MPRNQRKPIFHTTSKEQEIETLFRHHYVMLCNDVNRLLRDESLSEDLVQEVFIKIWEKKMDVDISDRFIFYLKRSCYNAALKYLSSKPYLLDTDSSENITTPENTDTSILTTELEHSIQRAITTLPDKTQMIFTLSRYEDLSYKEISKQLQISIKAVEKHMGKALKLMKAALQEHLLLSTILIYEFFFS